MLQRPWRIELFGGLRAIQGDRIVTRFRTEKTAVLLGYLAFHAGRSFTREELIDLLWPEADIEHGRMSLRTALSSLRRQLEPPGTPPGAVLAADPVQVRLSPAAVETDILDFESALATAADSPDDSDRARSLATAAALYRGELLSGYFDDWITAERERLTASYLESLRRLIRFHAQSRELSRALGYAQSALQVDPLNEDLHRDVARLYLALGRPQAASGQLDVLYRILRDDLDRPPSEATRQLREELSRKLSTSVAPRTAIAMPGEPEGTQRGDFRATDVLPPADYRLPVRFTRFFGRQEEIARLREALKPDGDDRLFTLTGPGGTGKTRLALETADSLAADYGGSAWFIPLEDVIDGGSISGAIADVMRLARSPSISPLDQVLATIGGGPSLLVLDNVEQIADKAAPIVLKLLSRAPGLRCLVTSRRRLGLPGEREIPLGPLPVPTTDFDPEPMMQVASVQLYVDRAQAVRPDFQVTRGNAEAVAKLCGLLEGMPLALELAAARAQVLTPAQTAEGLAERFALLAGRRGDKSSRHRSLWAAIDWSFRLLSPELQQFFTKLSVFRGGCSEDAAMAVTGDPRALEFLSQLRMHSLLVAEERGEAFRYRLLESIRDFGDSHLSDDERIVIETSHTAYFVDVASSACLQGETGDQSGAFARLEEDHENVRSVLRRLIDRDPLQAMAMASDLSRFWGVRGHFREGRAFFDEILNHPANQPGSELEIVRIRAGAVGYAGGLAWRQEDLDAALACFEESLHLFRQVGDHIAAAYELQWKANVLYRRGEFAEAEPLYRECLDTFRTHDNVLGMGYCLEWLGNVDSRLGRLESAALHYKESLEIAKRAGEAQLRAYALSGLGYVSYQAGQLAEAEAYHRESVLLQQELGDRLGMAYSFEHFAFIASAQQRFEDSVRLAAAATALREELGAPLPSHIAPEFEEMSGRNRSRLSPSVFDALVQDGRSLDIETAVCIACGGSREKACA